MDKKKIYIGLVVVLLILSGLAFWLVKMADQKVLAPTTTEQVTSEMTTGIPDNMAISEELGG